MITLRHNQAHEAKGDYSDKTITPSAYFADIVATQAIQKMERFLARQPVRIGVDSPELLKEMRTFKLSPETLELVKWSSVGTTVDQLLTGNAHREFKAILDGKPADAAVYHLRRLVKSGAIETAEGRKELKATDHALKASNLIGQVNSLGTSTKIENTKSQGLCATAKAEAGVGYLLTLEIGNQRR
jgi:hypothetical protein